MADQELGRPTKETVGKAKEAIERLRGGIIDYFPPKAAEAGGKDLDYVEQFVDAAEKELPTEATARMRDR